MDCGFGLEMGPLWPQSGEIVMLCPDKVTFDKSMIGEMYLSQVRVASCSFKNWPEQMKNVAVWG